MRHAFPAILIAVVFPHAATGQQTIEFGAASNVSETPTGTARSDYRMVVDPDMLQDVRVQFTGVICPVSTSSRVIRLRYPFG